MTDEPTPPPPSAPRGNAEGTRVERTPRSVKDFYHGLLAAPVPSFRRGEEKIRAEHLSADRLDPEHLVETLFEAETAPVRVFKQSGINLCFQAQIMGRDVVVKRYGFARSLQRARYRFRASRGRRDAAAAQTMLWAGIMVPEPLGFVEVRHGVLPDRSYSMAALLPDAQTARSWIRPRLHRHPPEFRTRVGSEIRELLLSLYRLHIYHADTKTGNLLVSCPEDPERRAWHWIDLDCVRFGCPPSRSRVLRNLVQLNGSLGSKLPDEDRLAFLAGLAETFPWVGRPRVAEAVRAETLRRLRRELEGICGP